MTNNVYWTIDISIKSGALDDLKALMDEMIASTQNEDGALNYEWWISDDSTTCHIYERYTDAAAAMVHIGNFGAHFAERFMGLVDVTRFIVYGGHDENVRGALGGMGAAFMGSLGGFSR